MREGFTSANEPKRKFGLLGTKAEAIPNPRVGTLPNSVPDLRLA
jgi:hypothetical protein